MCGWSSTSEESYATIALLALSSCWEVCRWEFRARSPRKLRRASQRRFSFTQDWQLQSSCEAHASGEQVSTAGFDASKWHRTDLPNTVVGALVDDKTYPDPTYGTNLKSLPGMDYSSKTFFALQDMPKDSPFRCSWWFRTEFTVPAEFEEKTQWLDFLGINYRANMWINGKKLADEKDVAGTFATFEFNVSKFLDAGQAECAGGGNFRAAERTIWASHGWTGIRRLPIRTWASGRKCF